MTAPIDRRRRFLLAALSLLVLSMMGCAVGMQSIEADMAMGHQVAAEVENGLGIVPPDKRTNYVRSVGQRLVEGSADQPFYFSFYLVDQDVPNAFAAPGGWTYYTRGLLMLTADEHELAAVIGHEMSHVIYRHTARQLAKARGPGILRLPGRIVGRVLSEDLGNLINAPVDALGTAYIARNSRQDEYEADRGGQQLAARAGYEPAALATILQRLEHVVELETGEQRIPGFFDSHPSTPDRIDQIRAFAAGLKPETYRGVTARPDEHLKMLDGLLVGENPAMGIIRDNRFMHPDLGIAVDYPSGWLTMNTRQAVIAMAKEQDALIALGLAGEGDEPSQVADYLVREMKREYRVEPTRSEAMTINGMPAHVVVFSDTSGREAIHMGFAWIAYDGNLYQYMGLAPESRRQQLAGIVGSFRPLSQKEQDSITVTRLAIVAARQDETATELAKRTGSVWDPAMIAVVNSIDPEERLAQDRLVKIAIQEPYRGQ
jgi:predicted Zn-dependent protease